MTALSSAIQSFIDEVRTPDDEPIAFYDNADSVSSGATLTDLSRFAYSTIHSDNWSGRWLERPSVGTAANLLRRIASVNTTTGVVTHDGANYSGSDTAVLDYRVWREDWHPRDYVVPLLNRALRHAWQWWREVLSVVANAGGEDSSVGGSDVSSTTTRGTTAASVFMGQAAFVVTNSGADGYHQSATFDAGRGQPFKFYVWVRVTTGSACTVTVYDITNSAAITTAVVTAGSSWTLVEVTGTFPTTCDRAAIRVGAASATAVTVWDSLAHYWGEITLVEGPSWFTQWRDDDGVEAMRLVQLEQRIGGASVTVTGTGGASAGPGRSYRTRLVEPAEYQVLNMPSAANPVQLELSRDLWDRGALFIEAKRPFSNFNSTGSDTAITAETGTNTIPLRLWVRTAKMLMAEERGHPALSMWTQQYHEEQRRVQSMLRTPPPDQTGLAWQRLR